MPTHIGPSDFDLYMAEQQILGDDSASVSVLGKKKRLLKFGQVDVGTSRRTVGELGSGEVHETFVGTNAITHVASEDDGDTGSLVVEGHTISGSDLTFVVQTVTLAGNTKTPLSTPLARATRAYNATGTEWAGPIYVAEDVTFSGGTPQTATAIHLVISAGEQQSFKAATTISASDYWIITEVFGSILKKTAGFVDFRLEVRESGGVFRPAVNWAASSAGAASILLPINPPLIVPPNSDVRITALADATATCAAWVNGYLAN